MLILELAKLQLFCLFYQLYIYYQYFIFLKKDLKNLKIPISVISFIDNGLFISQNKFFHISNSNLFCSYYVISLLLEQFGLVIKHGKTEVFHFSRLQEAFNPLPSYFSILGGPILCPKETWCYFSFIFDRKLYFHQHVNFYVNKAFSTVKSIKMLGNLTKDLVPS